ncbi:MAG TPA: transporter substrate-binding domain-containing protein [Promineifilum sp.]
MTDNLEGTGADYDGDPRADEIETRVYEADLPERNYSADDVAELEAAQRGINWLLVGLVGLAAIIVGLILFLLLSDRGNNGIIPSPGTPSADGSWERVRSNGRMVVGTSLDYPPFTFRNEQFAPDGFEIALITDIANRLGIGTEIKDMAFDSLGNALELGQIDVAIAAISVTPERETQLDFSNVYWVGEEGILARADSAIASITTLSQMAGQRIGVQRGSVYETWLQQDLVDSGMTQAGNLFVYATADAAVRDLREQRLDLVVLDKQVADSEVSAGSVKLVGSGLNPQRYAIAFRRGSDSLRFQINSALTQLQNEGQVARLAQQFLNVSPDSIITPPPPTATVPGQPTVEATTAPCVNGMRFVADLNLDDNNMQSPPPVSPGQPFSKGWRIQNSGTCAWTTAYRLVYVSGNTPEASMGGQPTPIQGFVQAGQQYDIFVNLVAPLTPGVYQGIWQMVDDQNRPFGDRIWVGITVPASPTATPPPTQTPSPSINFTVNRNDILQGECVTFSWNVQNATAVYFYAQGEAWQNNQVPPVDNRVACPNTTTNYFLRVLNPNGTVEERQITITVRPNVDAPNIVQFAASPSQVTVGQCVQLQWDVQGSVNRVTLSNQFRVIWDNAPARGNTQDCTGGQPTTIEYKIQASGPGGTSQSLKYVSVVSPATATPAPTAPPSLPIIDLFSVSPAQIQASQCIQINWSTSGATSLVRLLRNNVLVLDNAALTGSAQDCLPFAGNYTYRLVASTSGGQSTSRDQSVLVTEAPPANPLPGNTFDLTMLNGQPLIPETVITITFNSDGTLNGSAGCNNYNGRYTANNGQITISELSLTTMQCGIPPSVMDQELAYTNALRAAATFDFQQQNGLLIMYNAVGQEILRYVIKIEPLAVQLAGES